jgi:hypothetical protein
MLERLCYINRMKKKTKTPGDANTLSSLIVAETTGEEKTKNEKPSKNPAAVELGRLGGLKGGKVRAEKLTPEQRRMIAIKASHARWKKDNED